VTGVQTCALPISRRVDAVRGEHQLGFPYTGSDAYVLTVTLDKWLTKLVLAAHGVDSPRGRLITPSDLPRISEGSLPHLAFPVIVKPNYEGSSKGVCDDAVARDARG